jgi:hypothetical protein
MRAPRLLWRAWSAVVANDGDGGCVSVIKVPRYSCSPEPCSAEPRRSRNLRDFAGHGNLRARLTASVSRVGKLARPALKSVIRLRSFA